MTFLYEIVNWMNRKMVWMDSWAREIPLFCQLTWCQWVGWRRRRRGPGRQLILLGDARRWLVKNKRLWDKQKNTEQTATNFFHTNLHFQCNAMECGNRSRQKMSRISTFFIQFFSVTKKFFFCALLLLLWGGSNIHYYYCRRCCCCSNSFVSVNARGLCLCLCVSICVRLRTP